MRRWRKFLECCFLPWAVLVEKTSSAVVKHQKNSRIRELKGVIKSSAEEIRVLRLDLAARDDTIKSLGIAKQKLEDQEVIWENQVEFMLAKFNKMVSVAQSDAAISGVINGAVAQRKNAGDEG